MTPEDIGDIFQALEDALFAMAIRTMKHHENWEKEEGFQWTQWQAEQIQGLRAYRQNVRALTDYHFMLAKNAIEAYLREAYRNSVDDAAETARQIMTLAGRTAEFSQQFFGVNSKKLDVLINEAIQNIDTKRYAVVNRMNSGYTDMLRRADIFAQSGSFTIPQAVDLAAKDFLSAGLNCVEYSNGNRVNIASYAEMALRTSSSEVTRQANGDVRDELGEHLVVSNVIAMTCPICQKWQGKVMVDDVYSSGKPDGVHKLVSQSKADGFMHPNCRHQLYMYIPGLTEIADLPDPDMTRERYEAEQKQRYQERQIRKYKRLRDAAMDPDNKKAYAARVKEWTAKHDQFLQEHDYLRKNPRRLAPGYTGNGKPITIEHSRSVPFGENASTVDLEMVHSPKYRERFDGVSKNDNLNDSICNHARSMLEHRTGTNREDLVLLDFDSGEDIAVFDTSIRQNGIDSYPDWLDARIAAARRDGRRILAIHNHPDGLPATADDCASAYIHGYYRGVVVGHNGTIFTYEPYTERITSDICEDIHTYIATQVDGLYNYNEICRIWLSSMKEFDFKVRRVS